MSTFFEKLARKAKAWGWKLLTLPVVGVIYCSIISEGLRLLVPTLGQPLWKLPVPGISRLRGYQGLHRLDLAHMLSILLLFAVWYLWVVNLRILFAPRSFFKKTGWESVAYHKFVLGLGSVILIADGVLFYYAMTHQMGSIWGDSSPVLSIPSLLATAAYLGILIFVSFVSVNLEHHDDEGDK